MDYKERLIKEVNRHRNNSHPEAIRAITQELEENFEEHVQTEEDFQLIFDRIPSLIRSLSVIARKEDEIARNIWPTIHKN